MKTESVIRRVAGVFVLASLGLGWWVHPAWFLLAALVGLNLFQSSFTGFCPLESLLGRRRGLGSRSRERGPARTGMRHLPARQI